MTLRKSNAAVKESVNNHLFEETFPDDSIKVSPVVKLAASIHVATVNVLFLIGQYIIIFGNVCNILHESDCIDLEARNSALWCFGSLLNLQAHARVGIPSVMEV